MIQNEWWKCPKHGKDYEIRLGDYGKTVQVCPDCEAEREELIRKVFAPFSKEPTR